MRRRMTDAEREELFRLTKEPLSKWSTSASAAVLYSAMLTGERPISVNTLYIAGLEGRDYLGELRQKLEMKVADAKAAELRYKEIKAEYLQSIGARTAKG